MNTYEKINELNILLQSGNITQSEFNIWKETLLNEVHITVNQRSALNSDSIGVAIGAGCITFGIFIGALLLSSAGYFDLQIGDKVREFLLGDKVDAKRPAMNTASLGRENVFDTSHLVNDGDEGDGKKARSTESAGSDNTYDLSSVNDGKLNSQLSKSTDATKMANKQILEIEGLSDYQFGGFLQYYFKSL
jgi:hypothetical protein